MARHLLVRSQPQGEELTSTNFRASQLRQWNKVKSLMKLMLRSRSNLLLSVRQITQENKGRNTPGIDGEVATTAAQRGELVRRMSQMKPSQVQPVRRVEIAKASGKRRPLGIPSLMDRVAQTQVKQTLEPVWEARFEGHSYGFRPGRSAHDAIEYCWCCLKAGTQRPWVLKADIEGAFDHIDHAFLLKTLGPIPGRAWIERWLKAGYVHQAKWYATDQGTPQGSGLSPLLLNIALHGLENELHRRFRERPGRSQIGARYRVIRYADDIVILARSREDLESLLPVFDLWLMERGLKRNLEKSCITNVNKGFEFLGFEFRRFRGKCLTLPSQKRIREQLAEARQWLKKHPSVKAEVLIRWLNPKLIGWAQYYKVGTAKKALSKMSHEIWKAVWNWSFRRHPKKGKPWVKNRYFRKIKGRDWCFATTIQDRRGQPKALTLHEVSLTPIRRHIQVRGTASPDDPNQTAYWRQRQVWRARQHWVDHRRVRVAQTQKGDCPHCHTTLLNGEPLHLHHRQAVQHGGQDHAANLVLLHQLCHEQLHTQTM